MIITNLTLNNYHKNSHQGKISVNKNLSYSHNFSFGNNISLPQNNINRLIESCLGKLAILQRKLKNRIRMKEQSQNINTFYQKVINIDENSPEYIKYLHGYAKSFARGKEVEINLESRRILDIVNSDDSCIFIVNHDAPKKDPAMLGIFNTLLNGAYIVAGKSDSYDQQCYARAYILNDEKWELIYSIPYAEMNTPKGLCYHVTYKSNVIAAEKEFKTDIDRLKKYVGEILF